MQQSTTLANTVAPFVAHKAAKLVPEVVTLNRVNLKSLIESMHGKFVSIDFVKADGETRTLTGRLGVKAYLAGGQNKVMADERPYLTMFDIQISQYRTVNLETVMGMRARGKSYRLIG